MNPRQQPAPKPERLRTTAHPTVASTSPALHGATSAFMPRQSPATTTLSPLTASPSSAGARLAAKAVTSSPKHQSTSPEATQRPQQDLSPERGRTIQLPLKNIQGAANHAVSSQTRLSPTRSLASERSPSTIAAMHASSQATSPSRSPNRSPQRRANTLANIQTSQISPSDLSRALAGAVKSVASIPKNKGQSQSPSPVRIQKLNFDKIPPIQRSSTVSAIKEGFNQDSGGDRPTRGSTLVPQSSLKVPDTARDRAHSISDEIPSRRQMSRHESTASSGTSASPGRRPAASSRHAPNLQRSSTTSQPHVTRDHHGLTVHGLADAIVASSLASSLASSRAASPTKRPILSSSRRRSRSFSALYDLSAKYAVEPPQKPLNPPRPMKRTLRKNSEADNDDEEVELVKRGRRHWMRKHPNKHHEGDRKRWRDKVTESERKRYEGLFAANRGLLIGAGEFKPSPSALADNSDESNKVANVLVRDIWERSRLPPEILMEIYDLVAPDEDKSLNREQFVVGMWLVDQRLKGRKLPVKVSSSVWSSVRHPDGIKLRRHAA